MICTCNPSCCRARGKSITQAQMFGASIDNKRGTISKKNYTDTTSTETLTAVLFVVIKNIKQLEYASIIDKLDIMDKL